jgi:hypothetical protein
MAGKIPRPPQTEPAPESGEKVVQTFRLPVSLVAYLRKQAQDRGLDLTALVNKVLDGLRSYFDLAPFAIKSLEEDRKALNMDRFEYFRHVFDQRSRLIDAKGPGFDLSETEKSKSKR